MRNGAAFQTWFYQTLAHQYLLTSPILPLMRPPLALSFTTWCTMGADGASRSLHSDGPSDGYLGPVLWRWQTEINADLLKHISLDVLGTGKSLLFDLAPEFQTCAAQRHSPQPMNGIIGTSPNLWFVRCWGWKSEQLHFRFNNHTNEEVRSYIKLPFHS